MGGLGSTLHVPSPINKLLILCAQAIYKLCLLISVFRYESLVGTVAKKFSTKRKRSSAGASRETDSPSLHQPAKKPKREFMKPRD